MNIKSKVSLNIFIISVITIITAIAINNLSVNLIRTNVGINFNWLSRPSGFSVAESALNFNSSDIYLWAIFIGWLNSLKIIFYGLILSTIIGTFAGIARISSNKLISQIARLYVALIRQTPLLLQLLFWYFVVFLGFPKDEVNILNSLVKISNQGLYLFGINLSTEFSALLIGLSLFTGASIAEVIRGGLNSVKKGQIEAFKSLGVSEGDGIRIIIIPQALPAILPGLTSQYLNLAKNSTLAIAIGYPDIYAISDTTITQTGRAIEGFLIILTSFLVLNLVINSVMNIINRLVLRANQKR